VNRILFVAPLAAVVAACSSEDAGGTTPPPSATPTPNQRYIDVYLGASSALDAATSAWRTAVTQLANSGTDSTATEAPFDTAYGKALNTFDYTLLSISFPSVMLSDVNTLINAGTAAQADLVAIAAGQGSVSQFVKDETTLQAAINVVQTDMGLARSTP
jgi:hypothetical protein